MNEHVENGLAIRATWGRLLPGLLAATLWLAPLGCTQSVARVDERELDHPLMARASAKAREGNIEAAVELYQKVIEQQPTRARAHLNIAALYEDSKELVDAIYHYRRYLAMRPSTEKAQMIRDRIRIARMAYAATVYRQPPELQEEIAQLQKKNVELEKQSRELRQALAAANETDNQEIRRLRARNAGLAKELTSTGKELATAEQKRTSATKELAAAKKVLSSTRTQHTRLKADHRKVTTQLAKLKAERPPWTTQQTKTYRVRVGDTLSDISQRMYGDSSLWLRIYNANRDKLGDKDDLRVGQQLVIPL